MKNLKLIASVIIVFAIIIMSVISMEGCSNNAGEDEVTTEKSSDIINKVSDEETSNTGNNNINEKTINLNEDIKTDFMQVTISKIFTTFELKPADTSGTYSYYKGSEGNKYFVFDGTYKNTGTFAQGPTNSVAKIIFDDKYEYSADIYIESNNYLSSYYAVDPLKSCRFVIAASVPDELIEQYEVVTLKWGITENFNYTADSKYSYANDWNKIDTCYILKAAK